MSRGDGLTPLTPNSVSAPSGVIRPMRPASSVNHTLPSGPAVMLFGKLLALGSGNSVMMTVGPPLTMTARPTALPPRSVNQMLPSGPAVMSHGVLLLVGTSNSWKTPTESNHAILLPARSVNQTNGELA